MGYGISFSRTISSAPSENFFLKNRASQGILIDFRKIFPSPVMDKVTVVFSRSIRMCSSATLGRLMLIWIYLPSSVTRVGGSNAVLSFGLPRFFISLNVLYRDFSPGMLSLLPAAVSLTGEPAPSRFAILHLIGRISVFLNFPWQVCPSPGNPQYSCRTKRYILQTVFPLLFLVCAIISMTNGRVPHPARILVVKLGRTSSFSGMACSLDVSNFYPHIFHFLASQYRLPDITEIVSHFVTCCLHFFVLFSAVRSPSHDR